jgi:hypothetical protein
MASELSGDARVVLHFTIAPAEDVDAADLERRILDRSAVFSPSGRPLMSPSDLSHRVLRLSDGSKNKKKGDQYLWEIAFEGIDAAGEEPHDKELEDVVAAEVREQIRGLGVVASARTFTDVSAAAGVGASVWSIVSAPRIGGGFSIGSFSEEEAEGPGWEAYAPTSRSPEANQELPPELLSRIQAERDAIPAEPGLKKVATMKGGHMFGGGSDKEHMAYVRRYLDARAAGAAPADRRRVLAFKSLQGREGSTAAINTYDNQIVTWGTGWGGRGGLGRVMERALADAAVRDLFQRCGARYLGRSIYEAVDLTAKKVVSGTAPALEVIRASVPLLYMLIHAARAPAPRDAVTAAQLSVFMEGSGNISGAEAVETQALINWIAHLKHWAPGYVIGALEWATPRLGGAPRSVERDKKLAPLVGQYFYGKARKSKWIPDWRQFKLYWGHMKDDGLDCLDDPFIKASGPPAGDPFAAA